MTTDEFKQYASARYFDHIKELNLRTSVLLAEAAMARDMLELAGVSYDKVGSGGSDDSAIPNGLAHYFDVCDKVDAELQLITDEVEYARRAIAQLADERYRGVLTLYYIVGLPWRKVAQKLSFSEPHCYKIRNAALIAMFPGIPYEWKTRFPAAEPDRQCEFGRE